MARDAGGLEQLLAGTQQGQLRLVGDRYLRGRRQGGRNATGDDEARQQQQCCRHTPA